MRKSFNVKVSEEKKIGSVKVTLILAYRANK
jgi:hypothetical protein